MATPTSNRTTSPAFQFYPKDFLTSSKVIAMSIGEVGAYIKLLCICWLDGSIPPDTGSLARLVGVSKRAMESMWPAIEPCFTAKPDGRLMNARLDRERRKQAEFRRQQRERAGKRWDKLANADPAMPPHSQGNAEDTSDRNTLQSAISDLRSPISDLQNTRTRARAPLIDQREHRNHAHCGRVCLHASLFGEFVRRRNHDGADGEIRDWAMTVEREWGPGGPKAAVETGDLFDFWRARYEERWPAPANAKDKRPLWQREIV